MWQKEGQPRLRWTERTTRQMNDFARLKKA